MACHSKLMPNVYQQLSLPGNGGNAGHIVLRYQRLEGKVELESCRGTGAGPAKNGIGGLGKNVKVLIGRRTDKVNVIGSILVQI